MRDTRGAPKAEGRTLGRLGRSSEPEGAEVLGAAVADSDATGCLTRRCE